MASNPGSNPSTSLNPTPAPAASSSSVPEAVPEPSEGTSTAKRVRPKPSTDRQPGQTLLPLPRIQKIAKMEEGLPISKEGMYALAVATEEFIKHLAQAGHSEAMGERRSTIHYKDMASATLRNKNLNFLKETIPSPMTFATALAQARRLDAPPANGIQHDDADVSVLDEP